MSLSLCYVILAQFLIGFGLTIRLRTVTSPFSLPGLSMLTGMGLSSVLPLVLEFAHLPIAPTPMFVGLGVMTCLSILLLGGQATYLRNLYSGNWRSVRLCEIPFLGFWGYLLFISAWKCTWFPNLTFDTIVGPDLVASFAVGEKTLVSSVFTEHLPTVSIFSNQPFYAPFTAMQQIIYRLAGESDSTDLAVFGKEWLTALVVAFGLFLYSDLRERIHPLLAGILLTILACTPELFAYTFLVQTDWANAAFFASGVILLLHYLESGRRGPLIGSALLLAIACWTRTETIFFVPIGSLLVLEKTVRSSPKKAIVLSATLCLTCLIPVIFWNYVFLRGYIALPPTATLGTAHGVTGDYFSKLMLTYDGLNKQVIFRDGHWNYAVPIFLTLTVLNSLIFRDKRGVAVLIWIVGVYVLFGLIILHVDGANIPYTFRRGFFKLLFLMYFYLGNTSLFRWLSDWLYRWEGRAVTEKSGR